MDTLDASNLNCAKSLATDTTIINHGTQDITYTDTISWEKSESQTSSYTFSMETTIGATYSAGFLCGEAEFSVEVSFGYSNSKETSKETVYSFSKEVQTITPPGK